MAKQVTILKYSGRLGKKIGYKRDGKYYERSMPELVRQTSATRRAAQRFGRASGTGAIIRRAFKAEMDVHCDSSHINRLTKTLLPNNLEQLKGFRFNKHTGIARFFAAVPWLSGNGILHIPQQIFPVVKGITALEIKAIGVRIDFATKEVTGREVVLITIPTGESFAGTTLPLHVPGTGMLLVTLQVRGMYGDDASGSKQHLAADIIEVREPGIIQLRNKHSYPQQRTGVRLPVSYAHALLPVIQRE